MTTGAVAPDPKATLRAFQEALSHDDWSLAEALMSRFEEELHGLVAPTPALLREIGLLHADCLRYVVAARHRLAERAERVGGVQRAMRAYAHTNDVD